MVANDRHMEGVPVHLNLKHQLGTRGTAALSPIKQTLSLHPQCQELAQMQAGGRFEALTDLLLAQNSFFQVKGELEA